jgi:CIC family chloride channel protein
MPRAKSGYISRMPDTGEQQPFLNRLYSKLSNRQFLFLASILIAIWTGLTAVALKSVVHLLQVRVLSLSTDRPWVLFLAPAIGIGLTILFVRIALRGKLDAGTSHILFAIARGSSRIGKNETFSHSVTSALTVGMGGSAGLESPIVQTGSAIGSTFASFFPVGYKERTLLLACGASAGIAAAFNAPVAGVLFALEVLLVDIHVASFIPLLLSGAIGALCSKIILHEEILLSFTAATEFSSRNVPFYIVLGIVCGLVSIYYVRTLLYVQKALGRLGYLSRWLIGGICLGALIVVFPPFFGEGYVSIKSLAALTPDQLFASSVFSEFILGHPLMLTSVILILGLTKVFAVSLTLGSGGSGGNFAPSLFVGACVGFAFASFLVDAGFSVVSVPNFCLVGMAGVLTGVFHAPLTAMFLIAELTGGYGLMIPLMIVVALSTATSWYLRYKSLDETILAERMKNFSFDHDSRLIARLQLDDFIERDFASVGTKATLREMIRVISSSRRNVFPVVDDKGTLLGIIALEDIRDKMFDTSLYDLVTMEQLMRQPLAIVEIGEEMTSVMAKFDRLNVWNMPIVDQGKYIGFVSKSSIFVNYRKRLQRHETDDSQ